jgi:hypothetical protein
MTGEIQPVIRTDGRSHCRRLAAALSLLMLVFAASGANCSTWVRGYTQPRILPATATLDQIVNVVNENSNRVQSLQSTQASLSLPGAPTLKATVALAPPRRLRLRASSFTSPELDLGSNDEMFWLWISRSQPPATYMCRHDQFAMSNAQQIMPVEPEWLIDAAGLARFDTTQPLEGPFPEHGDRVEIRSHKLTTAGEVTQITVVDQWEGTVVEQDVYNSQGQLLAVARANHFQRDAGSGANLPRSIDVQWPTTQLSFHLDVSGWVVNGIPPDNLTWFTKPEYPGYPNIDLADPHLQFAVPGGTAPMVPAMAPAARVYPSAVTVPPH